MDRALPNERIGIIEQDCALMKPLRWLPSHERSPKALRALEPNPELRTLMKTIAGVYEQIAAKREGDGAARRPIDCPRD